MERDHAKNIQKYKVFLISLFKISTFGVEPPVTLTSVDIVTLPVVSFNKTVRRKYKHICSWQLVRTCWWSWCWAPFCCRTLAPAAAFLGSPRRTWCVSDAGWLAQLGESQLWPRSLRSLLVWCFLSHCTWFKTEGANATTDLQTEKEVSSFS